MGADTLWWGGCAWDSFALPHLIQAEVSVLVATRCPACQRPHAWDVNRNGPPDGHEVAHFLVPAAHMRDDVCQGLSGVCSRRAPSRSDAKLAGHLHPMQTRQVETDDLALRLVRQLRVAAQTSSTGASLSARESGT